MDILPIQGSAVPGERVFLSGKETMSMQQSRISHDLMEALQVLKISLRHGTGLSFTFRTSHSAQIAQMEAMAKEVDVPEYLSTFIATLLCEQEVN